MSEPNVNAIPTTRATHHSRTHKLTVTAMLSTVAFLLMFIEFPIPALIPAFVKLDISDPVSYTHLTLPTILRV